MASLTEVDEIIAYGKTVLCDIQREDGELKVEYCCLVAECSLDLSHGELCQLCDNFWTEEFLEAIMEYVTKWKANWRYFVLGIGNTIAYPIRSFIERLLTHASFTNFVVKFTNPVYLNSTNIYYSQALELSAWIIANILQGLEGDTPASLEPVIPSLLGLLKPVIQGVSKITLNFDSVRDAKKDQLHLRNFRSLCAIFSAKKMRLSYPNEYQQFLALLTGFPNFLIALLFEYRIGLQGKGIPVINFYPDAYQRALTVYFLSSIPEGKGLLVNFGVIPLLTRSLYTKFINSEVPTSLLWSRSIRSLYNIASNRSFHPLLVDDANIAAVIYAATHRLDLPKITLKERKLAAEIAVILRLKWSIERLFWIAQTESAVTCPLSRLPIVLIKPIMQWIIFFEDAKEYEEKYSVEVSNGYASK